MDHICDAKSLWASIFQNPHFMVFLIGSDGLILDMNHTQPGFKKNEVVGKFRIQDFYPDDQKYIPLGALDSIFLDKKPFHQYEYFLREQERYFSSIMMPVMEADRIIGASVISFDVTEEKKLQEKLIKISKMASVGELAAGVAHETNNPLMVIGFVLENLLELNLSDPNFQSQYQELCNKGKEGLDRINKIVSSLSTFARTNHIQKNISLNSCILNTVQLFNSLYRKEGIDIELNLSPFDDVFLGDEGKTSQIITNLLNNSKDALLNCDNPIIKVSTLVQDGSIILRVFDNGVGIEPDKQSQIFDAFFTTKDEGKGTGLGLSIVKTLAEEMKGHICLKESRPGKTVFEVKFEKKKDLELLQSNNSCLNSEQIKQIGKVLIIDDESDITYFVSRSLSKTGVDNKFLNDPEKALDLLKKEKFDLLIVDYVMPEMNGLELIRKISKEGIQFKKIILLSGFIDLEAIVQNEKFPENHVSLLKKPISTPSLIEHLLKVTSK